MEDHVFAADIPAKPSLQLHLDSGGSLEPGKARSHARSHIGGAHAGGEGPQRTVGAGVGIGPDDDLAGGGQALLRHQGVLDAHLAHVVEMGDGVLPGKLPAGGAQLGGFDVLAGGGVVQHDGDLVPIEH